MTPKLLNSVLACLALVVSVSSSGTMLINILSEVDSLVGINFCIHAAPCQQWQWVCLQPLEVLANTTHTHEHQFFFPTLPEIRMEFWANDLHTSETILALEEFRFPLSRRNHNMKLETFFNSSIEFSIYNKCDPHFYSDNCAMECVEVPGGNFKCDKNIGKICLPGWVGKDCDLAVCKSNCSSQGKCISPNVCDCSKGFKGENCEICIPSPTCANGGCVEGHNGTLIPNTCECSSGWHGENCTESHVCAVANPCKIGQGLCHPNSSIPMGAECECRNGFTGTFCEISPPVCKEEDNDPNCTKIRKRVGDDASLELMGETADNSSSIAVNPQ